MMRKASAIAFAREYVRSNRSIAGAWKGQLAVRAQNVKEVYAMEMKALYQLSYGLYVTGVETEHGFGGSTVDSVAQVSHGDPPRVILGSMNKNYTTESIVRTGAFTISVLGEDIDPFVVGNFGFQSARDPSVLKWNNVRHTVMDGLPTLDDALSCMRLKVEEINRYDTHTMFVCTVEDAWIGEDEADPLLYADYLANRKDAVFAAFAEYKNKIDT
jgi:flavin reductase (DIM6/NTAB) family NADH-FMN oxidoreductase RutF